MEIFFKYNNLILEFYLFTHLFNIFLIQTNNILLYNSLTGFYFLYVYKFLININKNPLTDTNKFLEYILKY